MDAAVRPILVANKANMVFGYEELQQTYDIIRRYDLKWLAYICISVQAWTMITCSVCDAMLEQVMKCPFDIEAISIGAALNFYQDGEAIVDTAFDYFQYLARARENRGTSGSSDISMEIELGRFWLPSQTS